MPLGVKSRLLSPMRSVGVVTDGLCPLQFQALGSELFATSSIGNGCFQVFKVSDKLRLSLLSTPTSDKRNIRHMKVHRETTFVARERAKEVLVYYRNKPIAMLSAKESHGNVTCLDLIQAGEEGAVLLVGHTSGVLNVWQIPNSTFNPPI